MEVGAVSVMMYCFRERELLLNINELLAGFRLFPSYVRVGGLREDLPRGFHDAVRAFLDRFPAKLDEYEDLLTKNEIYLMRTQGVGVISKADALAYSLVGPIARAAGVDCDVRKYFPYMGYDTFEFTVPVRTKVTSTRDTVRVAEMRESLKIAAGARPDQTDRAVRDRRPADYAAAQGSRVHGDGGADPALPDLLAGVHSAGRRGLRTC
jgi:NADH-quinone oxidoreductase subunit D